MNLRDGHLKKFGQGLKNFLFLLPKNPSFANCAIVGAMLYSFCNCGCYKPENVVNELKYWKK